MAQDLQPLTPLTGVLFPYPFFALQLNFIFFTFILTFLCVVRLQFHSPVTNEPRHVWMNMTKLCSVHSNQCSIIYSSHM